MAFSPFKTAFGSRTRGALFGGALGALAWGLQWAYINGLGGYTAGPMIQSSYWDRKTKSEEKQALREARRAEKRELKAKAKETQTAEPSVEQSSK